MILITGATGFIGSAVVQECKTQGLDYLVSHRKENKNSAYIDLEKQNFTIPNNVTAIIHCAGIANNDSPQILDRINVEGNLALYNFACEKNIKKFVYVISAHIYGIGEKNYSYNEKSILRPYNDYAKSKSTAEELLKAASKDSSTILTIVRPPLVYGMKAKGSISLLAKLAQYCPITPFGLVKNERSLISVEDLAKFLVLCVQKNEANSEDFVVAESKPVSTKNLYSILAQRKIFHLPIPAIFIKYPLSKIGKKVLVQQLFGDLTVDSTKAKVKLNWVASNSIYSYYGSKDYNFFFWQRVFDITFSLCGIIGLSPFFIILYIAGLFDTGKPLFIQERLGKNKKMFRLIKFRTMHCGTASLGTHEVSANAVTKWGAFLRKSKLDELPQLWNVLWGQMSLVGPRPCLKVQDTLTKEREKYQVFAVRPGITGLAQINEIDMSTPSLLAEIDAKMIATYSIKKYFIYILQTIMGKGFGDRIRKS